MSSPHPHGHHQGHHHGRTLQQPYPWMGLVSLASGICLLFLYVSIPDLRHSTSPFVKVFYLGIGLILNIWGVGSVLAYFLPLFSRLSRRTGLSGHGGAGYNLTLTGYQVRMTVEAGFYVVILFVLFVGAWMANTTRISNMLLLIFGLMAGPFIHNGWVTFRMLHRLSIGRTMPKRAMAGEWVSIDLHIANHKRWSSSWSMVAQDHIAGPHEDLVGVVMFPRVPPRGECHGTYQIRLHQRGRYHWGPIALGTRFPMGLMERALLVDNTDSMLVYPRIGQLTELWRRPTAPRHELAQQARTRPGVFHDEFHRLREYRPGDNPRAIHWRTSARRNELMVREFHQARDQHLLVLVDLFLPEQATTADEEKVELAVSFAATVCVEHCRRAGDSAIVLGIAGRELSLWEGAGNSAVIEEILERLATALATSRPPLAELYPQALALSSLSSRRVLITTRTSTDPQLQYHPASSHGDTPAASAFPFEILEATPAHLGDFFVPDPLLQTA